MELNIEEHYLEVQEIAAILEEIAEIDIKALKSALQMLKDKGIL